MLENELIIRNNNRVLLPQLAHKQTYEPDNNYPSWVYANNRKMFDSHDSDHTVPSRDMMVYRPSFYPLKESRERRMRTHYIAPNTIPFHQTKAECGKAFCVSGTSQVPCSECSCGYKVEPHADSFSSYNIPLEPETPEEAGVEEILVGLGDASDGWYRPCNRSLPPRKRFSTGDMRVPSQDDELSPPSSPFQGRISQIVQQHDDVNMKRKLSPPQSPEDEPRLVESGDEKEMMHNGKYLLYGYDDEIELEAKRKIKRARHPHHSKKDGSVPTHNSESGSTSQEEGEVGGICGKTNKPRSRKEYFYSKNSKTIFRWTCCGSQAKDHPDF